MTRYRKPVPLLDADFEANDAYLAGLVEQTRRAASRQMQRHTGTGWFNA